MFRVLDIILRLASAADDKQLRYFFRGMSQIKRHPRFIYYEAGGNISSNTRIMFKIG